jgi:hypothetical protein
MPAPLPRPATCSTTPWRLRARATEFRRMAETARDQVVRLELLRLAEVYLENADELERGAASSPGTA